MSASININVNLIKIQELLEAIRIFKIKDMSGTGVLCLEIFICAFGKLLIQTYHISSVCPADLDVLHHGVILG
jgi:hypothetical protein